MVQANARFKFVTVNIFNAIVSFLTFYNLMRHLFTGI